MSVLTEILISSLLSLLFTPQEIPGKTTAATTAEQQIIILEQVQEKIAFNCTTYRPK